MDNFKQRRTVSVGKWFSLWNNLSLKIKLIVSFSLLFVIFLSVSVYNLNQVERIEQQLQTQNSEVDKKFLALQLEQQVQELAVLKYGVMISRDLDAAEQYNALRQQFEQTVTQIAETANTPETRKNQAKLKTISGEYVATFDRVVEVLNTPGMAAEEQSSQMERIYDQAQAHKEYLFELIEAFNVAYTDAAAASVQETSDLLQYTVLVSYIAIAVSIAISAVLAALIISSFVRPIRRIQQAVALISEGDLRHKINSSSRDELGRLSQSFDNMVDKVTLMLSHTREVASALALHSTSFRQVSQATADANTNILRALGEITTGTEQQAVQSEQISGHITDLEAEMSEVARHTDHMKQKSREATHNAAGGIRAVTSLKEAADESDMIVNHVYDAMETLTRNSEQIGKIVNAITDIANQTNVLALNAAIEAARAGVHGKGFAVIAEQVRILSSQTGQSSKSISQIISSVLAQMNELQKLMERAKLSVQTQNAKVADTENAFQSIRRSIDEITVQMDLIHAKVEQTKARNAELVASIQTIAAIAEETAASVEEVNSTSIEQNNAIHHLADQAEDTNLLSQKLNEEIGKFKIAVSQAEKPLSEALTGQKETTRQPAQNQTTPVPLTTSADTEVPPAGAEQKDKQADPAGLQQTEEAPGSDQTAEQTTENSDKQPDNNKELVSV